MCQPIYVTNNKLLIEPHQ